MKTRIVLLAVLLPAVAFAVQVPKPSSEDPGVRVADYDRDNVVRLDLAIGVKTHIELGKGETVDYVATGDDSAWDIGPAKKMKNHVFIKPIAKLPDTNMTIVTDRRTYTFDLKLVDRSKAFLDVRYRFPEQETAASNATKLKAKLDQGSGQAEPAQGDNTNYWMDGAESLAPSRTWDDGRFTYLVFPRGAALPSPYVLGDDGEESSPPFHIDAKRNVVVIEQLFKQLNLRQGDKLVLGVFNKSYAGPGTGTETGTISNSVERTIIKGGDE
jgi:type IV secretion system protein VirB9